MGMGKLLTEFLSGTGALLHSTQEMNLKFTLGVQRFDLNSPAYTTYKLKCANDICLNKSLSKGLFSTDYFVQANFIYK